MYQKIPCRGVGKNYKVILKYCIQFNVIINSLYLFIYFIQVQHQATLSCHLPRVAVRQRTTYCGRRHATGTATAADVARDRDGKTKWEGDSEEMRKRKSNAIPTHSPRGPASMIMRSRADSSHQTSQSPRCSSEAKPQPTTTANDAGSGFWGSFNNVIISRRLSRNQPCSHIVQGRVEEGEEREERGDGSH